jgi:hypothetical protein
MAPDLLEKLRPASFAENFATEPPKATKQHTPKRQPQRSGPADPASPAIRAPAAAPSTELRKTELIGLTDDGRMVLWSTENVRPVSAFATTKRGYIDGGHFVIEWKGHAITVHCGNYDSTPQSGLISVQFMCNGARSVPMRRGRSSRCCSAKSSLIPRM